MKQLLFLMLALTSGLCMAQAPLLQWQKTLGGTSFDAANDVLQTADGGIVSTGFTMSADGDLTGYHQGNDDGDAWIIKQDASGNLQWQKTLGGTWAERAYKIIQNADGSYVIVGYTTSNDGDVSGNYHEGYSDLWVVKLSEAGDLLWQKCYGGYLNETGYDIISTTDGGYIIAGSTTSNGGDVSGNHGGEDAWVVKIDASGNLQWQKTFGGTDADRAYGIVQTADGGYVFCSKTYSNNGDISGNHAFGTSDISVAKTDASGNIIWKKIIGGTGEDVAYSIQPTEDAGFILAGWTTSSNGDIGLNQGWFDALAIKLYNDGAIQWVKTLGGLDQDYANNIQQTTDGGYILAGNVTSSNGDVEGNHGMNDCWIVKLDANGNQAWQKTIGGTNGEGAYAVQQTADNGYVFAGFSYSSDGDVSENQGLDDFLIVKLGPDNLSVSEFSLPTVYLYPNPTTDCIQLSGIQYMGQPFLIVDMSGKQVSKGTITGQTIDVSHLSNGAYVIQSGKFNEKFIKN